MCELKTLEERTQISCGKLFNQIIEDPNHRLHTLLPELNTNTTHSVRTMRKSRNAGLIDTRAPLLSLVLVAPNFNILLFIFCT